MPLRMYTFRHIAIGVWPSNNVISFSKACYAAIMVAVEYDDSVYKGCKWAVRKFWVVKRAECWYTLLYAAILAWQRNVIIQ